MCAQAQRRSFAMLRAPVIAPAFPRVQGHRGDLYAEPENTLAAFRSVAAGGGDAIELDVFLTSDRHLVVFHGGGNGHGEAGGLEELTTSTGNIQLLTLAQAQSLIFRPDAFACPPDRVTAHESESGHSGVPTLEDALVCCRDHHLNVTVELKGQNTEIPTVQLLTKLGMLAARADSAAGGSISTSTSTDNLEAGTVNLSSFDHARAARVRVHMGALSAQT